MAGNSMSEVSFKAFNGQFNIDQAEGIVECFVAAIGNKDSVGDVVISGAFTESLKRRKPRVVWGHSWNDPIGKVLEIYEVPSNDPRLPGKMKQAGVGGLYAKVQFNLATEKGREAFASVAFFGHEQEWSIGYKTIQASFDPNMQANILKEVELYEVSPVLHGANQLTSTLSVKSDEAEKGHMPMGMHMPAFGPQQEPKLVVVRLEDDDDDNEERDLFAEGEAGPISDEQRNALEMELMSRSSEPIKILSATENSAIFVRKIGDSKLMYRIAYHFDEGQREFMFGKPERLTGAAEARVSGTTVIPSQMPGMPMTVKPGMSVPMQPTQMLMQKFDAEKSLDFSESGDDKLQTIIDMLSQLIPADEKSDWSAYEQPEEFSVFLKTEQIYEAKQLLDPVLDYHRLEWTIDDEGIHVTTPVDGETLDALRSARSNIYSHFGRGSLGKSVGASEKSGAPYHQEVKALGGKLGSRIGGGLRSAGPGMSFVDITGTVDADVDGIVFEGKPGLERPIIPRFVVPKELARKLSKLTVGDAMSIEKQRRAGNTNIQFDENRLRSLIRDLGEDPSVLARMSDDGGLPDAANKPAMRSMSSMSDADLQREWDANKPYNPGPGVIGMNPMLEDGKVARRREILKEMRKRGIEPEGGIPANIALGEVFERARGDFNRLKPSGKPGYSRADRADVLRGQPGMRSFAKPDRKIRKARQAVDRAEQFYKRENDFVVNNIADGFTHSTYDQDKPIREFTKKDRFGSDIPFKEYEGTIKSGPFKGWDYEVSEEWTENEDSRVYGVRGSITSPNGTKYSIGSSGDWSGNTGWAPFELYGIIEKPFGLRSRSGGFPLGDNRPPLGGRKQQIEIVFERPSREDQKKYDIQRQMDEVQKEIDAWTRGMGSYERRDGTVVTVRKPDEYRAEKAKEKLAKLQKRLEDTQAEIDYRDRSRKEREEQAVRPLNKQENERMEELRKKLIDPRTGRPRSKQGRMREYEDYLRNYWKRRLEDEKRDISLQYSDFNGGDFEQWDESFKRQLRELRALERRDQESKLPSGSRSKPESQDSDNLRPGGRPSWWIEPLLGNGSIRRGTSGNTRSGMRSSSDWGKFTYVKPKIDWARPEKEKDGVLEWEGSMGSKLYVVQLPTTGQWVAWEYPLDFSDPDSRDTQYEDPIELGSHFNIDGAIDFLRSRERENRRQAQFNQRFKEEFDAAERGRQGMRSRTSNASRGSFSIEDTDAQLNKYIQDWFDVVDGRTEIDDPAKKKKIRDLYFAAKNELERRKKNKRNSADVAEGRFGTNSSGMRSRASDKRAVDEFLSTEPGTGSVIEERRRIDFTRPDDEFDNIREWLGSSGAILQIEEQDDGSFVARVLKESDSSDDIELLSEDIFSSEGEAKRYLNREYSALSRRSSPSTTKPRSIDAEPKDTRGDDFDAADAIGEREAIQRVAEIDFFATLVDTSRFGTRAFTDAEFEQFVRTGVIPSGKEQVHEAAIRRYDLVSNDADAQRRLGLRSSSAPVTGRQLSDRQMVNRDDRGKIIPETNLDSVLADREDKLNKRLRELGFSDDEITQLVGSGMRSRSKSGKKKQPSRKLTPEQVRISQEQKLRSKKVPGKRKDGPTKQEWGFRSRSQGDTPRFITGDGFNSDIPSVAAYTAARRASTSRRGGGMRSRSEDLKAGRTEIAGEATFFKQILDSLPKEISAARTAGDTATAKALGELAEIMRRQKSGEVGPKRTNAGAIYLTQAEADSIIDALMFVLDRQSSTGGSRAPLFSQLIDLLASAALSTFIDKATPEIHDRFIMRENSEGRMVKIPISR